LVVRDNENSLNQESLDYSGFAERSQTGRADQSRRVAKCGALEYRQAQSQREMREKS
jgi:hypothetical protein